MQRSKQGLLIAITAALTAICLMIAEPGPARAQSGNYKESPVLAEQVKAGRLEPIDKRIPDQPLVVPVVEKVGEYGGVWRRAFLGPADANNYVRIVCDNAVERISPHRPPRPDRTGVPAKRSPWMPVRGPCPSARTVCARPAGRAD